MRVSTSVRNIGISGFSCNYGEVSTAANPVNVIVYQKDWVPPLTRVTVNLKDCSDFTLRYDMFIILELSNCLHLVAVYRSPRLVAMSAFFQNCRKVFIFNNVCGLAVKVPFSFAVTSISTFSMQVQKLTMKFLFCHHMTASNTSACIPLMTDHCWTMSGRTFRP
jgi:hypothetical protein